MRELVFSPLRRVKKTGKIVVASYASWRTVKTADYSEFLLIVNDEYKRLPPNAFVYDHAGSQLFWRNFMPDDIPVIDYVPGVDFRAVTHQNSEYGICWQMGYGVTYNVRGLDCDGVPTFSHQTADYVADHCFHRIHEYEPLTVETVVKWFGWFLYQLDKSHLQIRK